MFIATKWAAEAEVANVDGMSLDAAPVEPGMFAGRAHHGAVGLLVPHRLQADEAGGVLLRSRLHCLLWAVLPAEGPGEQRKGMGEVRSAGSFFWWWR